MLNSQDTLRCAGRAKRWRALASRPMPALLRWIGRAYVFLFARPALQGLNLAILHLALRARGYNNCCSLELTGEGAFLERLARTRPKLCLDVGANQGGYSAELLRRTDATVLAFEPLPSAFEHLSALEAEHGGRFIAFNVALGDADGDRPISYGPGAGRLASLVPETKRIGYVAASNIHTMQVPVRRLDDVFLAHPQQFAQGEIDLLKIDTEGYEASALLGAPLVIERLRPRFIQVECNWHHLFGGTSLWQLARLLPGYRCYQLLPYRRGWHRVDPGSPEANVFHYSNFVFVRDDVRA